MRHRCDFCGRFFSSPLPDAYGCPNHIEEANAKLSEAIARSNRRIALAQVAKAREAQSSDSVSLVSDGGTQDTFPDPRKQDA